MKELRKLIENAAKKEGIDLLGFASRDRFESVDPSHNPFSIFPEGKTVIMVGKRICRGTLRGVEEGTNFEDYRRYGNRLLEDKFLAMDCYNLVRVIEDNGWEAVPIFPNPPELKPEGIPVAEGKPAPDVYPDFDYCAVACGLGEISYSGLFFSKEYGARQRFHMIITDAELEPTPISDCKICDRCMKCADVCPLGAISKTETETINICGKEMVVAKIDYNKCRDCKNGACANRFASYARPDRVAAICNRTCMCHLEETDALENKFEREFRKREAWSIGGKK